MAEALLAELAHERGLDFDVQSAGTDAYEGMPAMASTIAVLDRETGRRLLDHRSRRLGIPLLEDADLVVGMTTAHVAQIVNKFPEFAAKTIALADVPGGRDIEDPYAARIPVYKKTRVDIEAALPGLIDVILERTGRPKNQT